MKGVDKKGIVGWALVLSACDGGAVPVAHRPAVGKGDCVACEARVSCAEEPAHAGTTVPLFRDLDDPHRYYAAPTQWAIESVSGSFWIMGSFQYFSPGEVAGFERNTLSLDLGLELAQDEDAIAEALRATDADAVVVPLPTSGSALERLQLAIPYGVKERREAWDRAALAAHVDLELTREGIDAAMHFFVRKLGVNAVAASLTFACEGESGASTRTLVPQAIGPPVRIGYASVPIDFSSGSLASAADQVMVNAVSILPYEYPARLPERELADLLRPLLGYPGTLTAARVREIGHEVEAIVDRWAALRRSEGADPEILDIDLDALRFQIGVLTGFVGEVTPYPVQ